LRLLDSTCSKDRLGVVDDVEVDGVESLGMGGMGGMGVVGVVIRFGPKLWVFDGPDIAFAECGDAPGVRSGVEPKV
jgi:hypothetical protein